MDPKELYSMKKEAFEKALNRQEPDYVPNTFISNGGSIFYSGKTVFDVADDPIAYADALTCFCKDMWIDTSILCGSTTNLALNNAFPTAENRFAKDGTMTHLQVSPMQKDEYDQLIADPQKFIADVLLPRKYPYLFEEREKTKELMKVLAEGSFDSLVAQLSINLNMMKEKYGVYGWCNVAAMLDTPLDHIFDFFRGFRGTLTDLRRQPEKVKAACDAIWEYREAEMVSKPYDKDMGIPFQPCHIPAYLSPKQYDEYYWPYQKKLIEWVYNSGSKIYMILEGKWGPLLQCFHDIPKDSIIMAVDDDNFEEVYREFGKEQIICGGINSADTRLKKFEDIKDDIKKVIDMAAPEGGLILNTNKSFLSPGDINQTLIDCYNFAHEYSKK